MSVHGNMEQNIGEFVVRRNLTMTKAVISGIESEPLPFEDAPLQRPR
jgi:hypothetical protein